jgi:hypothetical protein
VNFAVTPKATCGEYYNPTTQRLTPPGVSACTVVASWSNSSIYEYAQSDPTTLFFGKVTRTGTLAVKDPSPAPKAGDSITLIATYNGDDVTTDSDILFTVTPSDKCLLSGKTLRTDVIAYCNVIASWSNSSMYTYAQSASKTISFGIRQSTSPLTITNNDSYDAATTVTLSTGGGNGGTATYDVYGTSPDCIYNSTDKTLTANKATSCTVIARQVATGNFLSTQSVAKTIKFVRINPADALTLPTLNPVAGTATEITVTGGIPDGITANLTVSGPTGCGTPTVSGKKITITTTATVTCTVTASQNASDLYNFASVSKSYTFAATDVPVALSIATNLSGTAGQLLRVTATGGDQGATGSTPILYTVTGTGCTGSVSVNSSDGKSVDITPAGIVYCNVMASQAAHGIYKYAKSNVVNIAFSAANSDPLVIDDTLVGVAGTPLTFSVTGGNGGQITYATSGAGCGFSSGGTRNASMTITTSRLAYCTVTAKQSATGIYRPTLSNVKIIAFLVGDAPQELVVANNDADATDTITLASNAPSFGSQVKFKVSGTGCNPGNDRTSITTSGEAVCTVVAYWPAGSVYKYKESAPKMIRFVTFDQASFTINNSEGTTSAARTGWIDISTKGGSGLGTVSFKATLANGKSDAGCTFESVNGAAGTARLKSVGTAARTCTVTAIKAAHGKFKSASSQSVVFTFRAA